MTGYSKNMMGGILIAVAFFVFWTICFAEYKQITSFQDIIAQQEALLEKRKGIMEKFTGLVREYRSQSDAMKKYSDIVPAKPGFPELITMVESLQLVSGATLTAITLSDEGAKVTEGAGKVGINLGVRGSYPAIYAFLSAIEKSLRILDIAQFDISPEAGPPGQVNFTGSVRGSVYYIK